MTKIKKGSGRHVDGLVPHLQINHAGTPLFEQVYAHLRDAIISGRIPPGARLAGSRVLATEIGVSRFTLVNATERLLAEGYLRSQKGAGTWVTEALPNRQVVTDSRPKVSRREQPIARELPPHLGARGTALSAVVITGPRGDDTEARPFRPRRPPVDIFPLAIWSRLLRRQWSKADLRSLDYGDPAGALTLRSAIAEHVRATRGLVCTPRQVIVTSGAQQAFDILFRLLLDPGDVAWLEEPGYLDVRAALIAAGVQLAPVPVDDHGMDIDVGLALEPNARLAVVSPAHQFPTGVTLTVARRIALLAWARRANAWIVEDDYDSYFRYRGRPLTSLQQLDSDAAGGRPERVVYVGTFSKTMFPSLRLGYCVVPESLVDAAANARAVADRNSPIADQMALATFIDEGHYDRHLRRVRIACQERSETLVYEVSKSLGSRLRIETPHAGTHLLGWPDVRQHAGHIEETSQQSNQDTISICHAAAAAGLVVFPLSRYCVRPPAQNALVLGYGGLSPERIRSGVADLTQVFETVAAGGTS